MACTIEKRIVKQQQKYMYIIFLLENKHQGQTLVFSRFLVGNPLQARDLENSSLCTRDIRKIIILKYYFIINITNIKWPINKTHFP